MNNFIPVNEPLITPEDVAAVERVLRSGWVSSEGPAIKEFETQLADYHGRKYCAVVSSGTAALELCGDIFNFSEEDEVIIPDHTIVSCAYPIIKKGASPIFVDSDLKNWNIDINAVMDSINEKTKAIIVPHLYGLPVDLKELESHCSSKKIILIEDNAELMGGEVNGRRCGSFGDCSILSFYANKQITTGEGGAILTDSEEIYEKAKYYRNLCFKERRFLHDDIGHNYRMTNMQAALGLCQLGRMTEILKKRQEIADIYYHYLQNLDHVVLPLKSYNGNNNIFWVFGILLNEQKNDVIIKHLAEFGVGARPFFSQLSKQDALRKQYSQNNDFFNSSILSNYGLYLPSGLGTSLHNIELSAIRAKKILTEL